MASEPSSSRTTGPARDGSGHAERRADMLARPRSGLRIALERALELQRDRGEALRERIVDLARDA